MPYAVIEDVPASWERYRVIAPVVPQAARGLVIHLAGPTDEGFRIIEIWDTEADWLAAASAFHALLGSVDPDLAPRAAVRDLRAVHVVLGTAWGGPADGDDTRPESTS